jgi:hypothetical protein
MGIRSAEIALVIVPIYISDEKTEKCIPVPLFSSNPAVFDRQAAEDRKRPLQEGQERRQKEPQSSISADAPGKRSTWNLDRAGIRRSNRRP